jgi:hypothetical protein
MPLNTNVKPPVALAGVPFTCTWKRIPGAGTVPLPNAKFLGVPLALTADEVNKRVVSVPTTTVMTKCSLISPSPL